MTITPSEGKGKTTASVGETNNMVGLEGEILRSSSTRFQSAGRQIDEYERMSKEVEDGSSGAGAAQKLADTANKEMNLQGRRYRLDSTAEAGRKPSAETKCQSEPLQVFEERVVEGYSHTRIEELRTGVPVKRLMTGQRQDSASGTVSVEAREQPETAGLPQSNQEGVAELKTHSVRVRIQPEGADRSTTSRTGGSGLKTWRSVDNVEEGEEEEKEVPFVAPISSSVSSVPYPFEPFPPTSVTKPSNPFSAQRSAGVAQFRDPLASSGAEAQSPLQPEMKDGFSQTDWPGLRSDLYELDNFKIQELAKQRKFAELHNFVADEQDRIDEFLDTVKLTSYQVWLPGIAQKRAFGEIIFAEAYMKALNDRWVQFSSWKQKVEEEQEK